LRYFVAVGNKQGQGIDQLSAAQVETLRHVFAHHNSKEIARIMGVSPHTVDERLRRAIRTLGVTSRVEAARLVEASHGASTPQPLIYQPSQLGTALTVPDDALAAGGTDGPTTPYRIGYPFPTRSRPYNDHGRRERMLWPILIAFGTIMAFAALYTVLLGLGAMLS
jgi:DNA-binding CsgD family transcriptional regulator